MWGRGKCWPRGWLLRPATSGRFPRLTIPRWLRPRFIICRLARQCSPGSAPRASTSTWGQSSMNSTSDRFSISTCFHWQTPRESMGPTGSSAHLGHPGAKKELSQNGSVPTDPNDPASVIGVYASARRRKATILDDNGDIHRAGPWRQVSRLGSPLFNEVMIPLGKKDFWNSQPPEDDEQFLVYVQRQEVQRLLVQFYPGVFPHLAAYSKPRADMVAIFLTGIPAGIVPGFSTFTGETLADLLRLNLAIPPAKSPAFLASLAATSLASRMGDGLPTTCSPLSCERSRAPLSSSSIRRSYQTRMRPTSRMA
jgi:hypothetical protein